LRKLENFERYLGKGLIEKLKKEKEYDLATLEAKETGNGGVEERKGIRNEGNE
jgi:hypothetical protein